MGTLVDPECLKLTSPPTDKKCVMLQIMTDTTVLYTYTGLHSFELLDGIVECVRDLEPEQPQGKVKQLSLKERIVLTFIKLKLNLYFTTLAPLFGVTRHTCSKYFQDMVPKLRTVLESVVEFPEIEGNRDNMPLCFGNYKSTRVVIDCAETPVECCKCIKCRILTYSHYKKRNTLKFLVGVAPSGMIIFVSESYGGRASDKQVTIESGILNKVEFGGAVMADKGFNIKNECYERHLVLYQPPFLTRKREQFSREEALRTARIAKARVHVERAIQRLREFNFLTEELEWQLAPHFDDALVIAAGVVNLSASILNVDKF
ncbi:Putative transposase for insertion sequence element IS112 [Frankliniella fusca]|uniref:Transposase for insertion sequence element IS112 n=1 Tax=Frankliniella fusca TaxID=407009 RepID=A0AAE1I454_9NEOP|nr:Putative transposase for insertion sequence element IS112 [Frankliniella fusca]